MGGDARKTRFIGLATALLITFFLLISAGCGGGGSSSPSDNGGGPAGNSSDAFVTGRVVNSSNGQPLAGALVQYGSVSAVATAADGNFSIRVRSNAGTNVLKVTGAGTLSLYDYGTVNSQAYRVRTAGVPVPVLTAQQTYNVGNILVFTSDSAPPPPIF